MKVNKVPGQSLKSGPSIVSTLSYNFFLLLVCMAFFFIIIRTFAEELGFCREIKVSYVKLKMKLKRHKQQCSPDCKPFTSNVWRLYQILNRQTIFILGLFFGTRFGEIFSEMIFFSMIIESNQIFYNRLLDDGLFYGSLFWQWLQIGSSIQLSESTGCSKFFSVWSKC